MKVIVYGTLKRGYGNHSVLGGAEFVGDAIIAGYKLYYSYKGATSFGFPVACPCDDSSLVAEIYELPENERGQQILRALDRLEGEGRMYNRTEIPGIGEMYVGHNDCWKWDDMAECPVVDGSYLWSRAA